MIIMCLCKIDNYCVNLNRIDIYINTILTKVTLIRISIERSCFYRNNLFG